MKKPYEKPAFFAESYRLTTSVAACEYHIGDPDKQEALDIVTGVDYCPVEDKGHWYDRSPVFAKIQRNTTVFNDGPDNYNGCEYDWAGINSQVVASNKDDDATYRSFGAAFYGATADNPNHAAAYKTQVFYS